MQKNHNFLLHFKRNKEVSENTNSSLNRNTQTNKLGSNSPLNEDTFTSFEENQIGSFISEIKYTTSISNRGMSNQVPLTNNSCFQMPLFKQKTLRIIL